MSNESILSESSCDLVKKSMAKATVKGTLAGLKSIDIKTIISNMAPQISQALPKHLTADRIIQVATTYISSNSEVAKCTAHSIIGAIMQTSIWGLEPHPGMGHVYFVPYNRNIGTRQDPKWSKEVQLQIGYKGYMKLARNSGEIKMIFSEVVRQSDEFEFELGLYPKLSHVPKISMKENEKITHVYAVAHYHSGGYNFIVLSYPQIEALRKRNPSQKKGIVGAWSTDYPAMACAKALKQLSKYLPLSTEMQQAVIADESIITKDSFTNNQAGINFSKLEYGDVEKDVDQPDDDDIWVKSYDMESESK